MADDILRGQAAVLLGRVERLAELPRIQRCLRRPSRQRSEAEIQLLMNATKEFPVLVRQGPSLHHDLCFALQSLQMRKGESSRFKDTPGAGKAVFIVFSGSFSVYSAAPDGFEPVYRAARVHKSKSDACELSETDLWELFKTLDEDGSGSIDALELLHALQALGVDASEAALGE
eukprot:CAMPEP_0177580862 /NCGR_PEP_ID=MMETSP0419_2-20121207/1816_1 /TAXON_ID=582737 /ORGANISM="Tetraselmis sp., Strain GSL018" /LENGTH=173 /DNA_ID=CAMNT_0019069817 /DNA_START=140 /DNA_END=658 /DNA_ORIENTATION=-